MVKYSYDGGPLKKNRRLAERAAAELEAELRNGHKPAGEMTWGEFRERHELEAQADMSNGAVGQYATVFDSVEKMLRPRRLADVDFPAGWPNC